MVEEKKKDEKKNNNIKIEISGRNEEMMKMIQSMLVDILNKQEHKAGFSTVKSPKAESPKSLVNILTDFSDKGFFSTPRSLNEVTEQLKKDGYTFPNTTIAPLLLYLVRQEILVREGKRGGYKYSSKKAMT